MLKVLHICFTDGKEGAALGAYGLHRAMLNHGIDSEMLVVRKTTEDPTVNHVSKIMRVLRYWMRRLEKLILIFQRTDNTNLHTLNIFPTGIHRTINMSDADVVQLHWIGVNTISIGEITKIRKPVFWKMPDMWPFSGSEHYSLPEDSDRYINGYSHKNRPAGNSGLDIDKWLWLYKKRRWKHKKLNIIGTTNWIADCAKRSSLFGGNNVRVINNPIDLNLFKPVDKKQARNRLGLPANRKVILFGSLLVEKDRRKGYDKLIQAMRLLQNTWAAEEIILLVFGTDKKPVLTYTDVSTDLHYFEEKFLGKMSHNSRLCDAYNAADVYVTPSLMESFGLTAAESLACGTPVACFDTSGLKDIVDHEVNGYRASCYDADDLANGINWILKQESAAISKRSREKAEKNFNSDIAVAKYTKYYEDILRQGRTGS